MNFNRPDLYGIGGTPTETKPRVERGLDISTDQILDISREKGKHRVNNVAVGIMVLLLAGGGAVTKHYIDSPDRFNPQSMVEDIASVPGMALNKVLTISKDFPGIVGNMFKKEEITVPDKFDPTATKGVIGANNSVQMSVEEYQKLNLPEIRGDNVTIPLIAKLPEGSSNIIEYELGKNSMGIKRKIVENGEEKEVDVYSNLVLYNLPIGTQIISGWTGNISQGSFHFRELPDGSVESLQATITTSTGAIIHISTTSIKLARDISHDEVKDVGGGNYDHISHSNPIQEGEVIGTITSLNHIPYTSGNGQVALNVTDSKGVASIGLAVTPDNKLITLQ